MAGFINSFYSDAKQPQQCKLVAAVQFKLLQSAKVSRPAT